MCYVDAIDVTKREEYADICGNFISSVAIAYPKMLQKAKIHLLLHLPLVLLEYGSISAYNTERHIGK